MELDFFLKIFISAILGWIIWLERDISHKNEKEQFAWLRSYALIAILWTIWVIMDSIFKTNVIFVISILIIFSILIICAYLYATFKNDNIGITSELTAILTFFVWVFVWIGNIKFAIIFMISLTIITSLKERFQKIKDSIQKEEFMHTLKFASIAFVILPLLPDEKFSFNNLFSYINISETWFRIPVMEMEFFNPYSIWFFVVVMSWVGYIWYILSKIFGKNSSVILSSIIGWLVSSTAVTATMSEKSKKDPKNPHIYVLWVLAANSVMLLRVIWIVLFLNIALIQNIWIPAFLMLWTFVWFMLYSYNKSKISLKTNNLWIEEKIESPFSLMPALKFWLFIVFIKFIAWLWLLYKDIFFWDFFYYIFWIISWFADVDAITQTMTTQSREWLLVAKIAVSTILLAVMSNNIVKSSMAYKFWDKLFGKIVALAFWLSIILGIMAIIIF